MIMNQKGYASIAVAVLISVLALVLYNSVQNSTRTFLAETFRYRARLDAEAAIDVFAGELYRAFIMGGSMAEGVNNPRYRTTDLIVHNGVSLYSPAPSRICFQRSIVAGKVDPICVQLPQDLFVKSLNREEGIELVYEGIPKVDIPFSELARGIAAQTARDLSIPAAEAQVQDPWDPGLNAFSALNVPVARNFDLSFQRDYSRKNCTDPAHLCLKIRFCVRLQGQCSPEELIRQTYVFERPPATQLRN